MTTASIAKWPALRAGAASTVAVVALGFAGAVQARDNVVFSTGLGVPGVQLGISHVYPVYTQPQPVYTQPRPVYVEQVPVYVQPAAVYLQPRPVYYGGYGQPVYLETRPLHHKHRHHRHWRGGYYQQPYGAGYAPVYFARGGHRDHDRD